VLLLSYVCVYIVSGGALNSTHSLMPPVCQMKEADMPPDHVTL